MMVANKIAPEALEDIRELEGKIRDFQQGKIGSEKFRAFRLARGVYGQRQDGYQMIRIKLPFGSVSSEQLIRIAELSLTYGNGNLHATTRQDIQLHYVKLEDAPQLWAKLEEKGITLREACGNTIRNLTASCMAGIDPEEPFDVSPYVKATFEYFLRNAICQDLGRKFKIAFSSSEKDSAFTFIHDLGFIPKVIKDKDSEFRGFKVVLGGGLGAQPFLAQPVFEFLQEDQVIPFIEALIRIFDRYGERAKRHKARLKYLVSEMGLARFLELVEGERIALKFQSYTVDKEMILSQMPSLVLGQENDILINDLLKYKQWKECNVFEQKQKGYYGVQVKLPTGDLESQKAIAFAKVAAKYAADDIRVTVNQGYLLKYVSLSSLSLLFNELNALGLAEPGFDSALDITACPGTDTCNLGIASSIGLAHELERILAEEYPALSCRKDLKIKISGCMNACGHHTIAQIGFHGMSLKVDEYVVPAMQVLLGGGGVGNGLGRFADKVIKLPSKHIPQALRSVLDDYLGHASFGETFNTYYDRRGKIYFYNLLKPLATMQRPSQEDLLDWGSNEQYKTLIGVGECAGVMVDMVAILFEETKEKLDKALMALQREHWADAIYYSYNVFLHAGKALLLTKDQVCNTQYNILENFEKYFESTGELCVAGGFKNKVLAIRNNEPSLTFAHLYQKQAEEFLRQALNYRSLRLKTI